MPIYYDGTIALSIDQLQWVVDAIDQNYGSPVVQLKMNHATRRVLVKLMNDLNLQHGFQGGLYIAGDVPVIADRDVPPTEIHALTKDGRWFRCSFAYPHIEAIEN